MEPLEKCEVRSAKGDTHLHLGSVRVSGVWIVARKLGGELDVGGRRIL